MRLPSVRLTVRRLMVLSLGFALIFWVVRGRQDLFKSYPRSQAMEYHVRWQGGTEGVYGGSKVLKLTTFPGGYAEAAVQFQLDAIGHADRWWTMYNRSMQHQTRWRLTGDEMEQVRETVPTLPASDSPPPLRWLLIVGFDHEGVWTTRIYDRTKLPPEVVQLCRIVRFKSD